MRPVLLAMLLSGCASSPYGATNAELREAGMDAGPKPTMEQAIPIMEAAIRVRLRDPASAQFDWPNDLRRTSATLAPKIPPAWFTCGAVNGRNGFGGYSGKTAVIVAIANGQVVYSDMDRGRYRLIANHCAKEGMPVL